MQPSQQAEEIDMPHTYVASDYAGLVSKNLQAYYGYEETTADGEWCFVARVGETEVLRIPQSKLSAQDKFDCESCLLAGLAKLFDRYGIK
jgi:hypothetical protein